MHQLAISYRRFLTEEILSVFYCAIFPYKYSFAHLDCIYPEYFHLARRPCPGTQPSIQRTSACPVWRAERPCDPRCRDSRSQAIHHGSELKHIWQLSWVDSVNTMTKCPHYPQYSNFHPSNVKLENGPEKNVKILAKVSTQNDLSWHD